MSLTILNNQIADQIEGRTRFQIHYTEESENGKKMKDYFSSYEQDGRIFLVTAGLKKEITSEHFQSIIEMSEQKKYCTDDLIINADRDIDSFFNKVFDIK